MRVAVGCPIRNRAWILPEWIEHVRTAFAVAGLEPYWIFALGVGPEGRDDGTGLIVSKLVEEENGLCSAFSEPDAPVTRTNWTRERYEAMVVYRNRLLSLVRTANPDYFLSLDSDILLHPSGLINLLDTAQRTHNVRGTQKRFDAVGGKAILSEGSKHMVTYGNLHPQGGIRRQDSDGVFRTQILMAVKLMTPAAYNVDYEFHRHGEDVGWSLACARAGLTLGWDGRVISKHVMRPEHLEKVDPRVGW